MYNTYYGDSMNIPLSIDETDPKWNLSGNIMDIISSRRVKQVMAKLGIKPVNKASMVLRIVFIAMNFSKSSSSKCPPLIGLV